MKGVLEGEGLEDRRVVYASTVMLALAPRYLLCSSLTTSGMSSIRRRGTTFTLEMKRLQSPMTRRNSS